MPDRQATEKPTQKHKLEARRQGRVAKSAEISSWATLLTLAALLPTLGRRAASALVGLVTTATNEMTHPDAGQAGALLGQGLWTALVAVGPIVATVALVGVACNVAQVGFRIAPEALGFKWYRVSPRTGIKRVISPSGLWELAKSFLRLGVLVGVGYLSFHSLVADLLGPGTLPISATLETASAGLLGVFRAVGIAALVIALGDFAFQRRQFSRSLKMTKEEVRRENRETEGTPEMRREFRRRRRQLSRMQILAAVANADVIVVNPTHVAVALRYDRIRDRAPTVIGKGEDDVALALRLEAIARHIPVVENPPVARAIHLACQLGEEIPPSLYETVARLLAFVYRLTPAARELVDVHHLG